MPITPKLSKFMFPSLNRKFFTRIMIVAAMAYIIFSHIMMPLRIQGFSMEPTYQNGRVNFCFMLWDWFEKPERGDVVFIRFAGRKVMLLKRIIAFEGETVEFRDGVLFLNGNKLYEPYIRLPCNWNMESKKVDINHLYVIGDNRSVPMDEHDFGQVSVQRIEGVPVW